jgi:hypothetical protein
MTAPTPLLDFFRRGEVARDVRVLAAQGALAPRVLEQLSILALLVDDPDEEIRQTANDTIERLPARPLAAYLGRSDTPVALREFFLRRGIVPASQAGEPTLEPSELPLVGPATPDAEDGDEEELDGATEEERKLSAVQKLANMTFTERLKAAFRGTREMRAILIRDPNRMIAMAVLSSPKLSESEIEGYARMGSVSEDVLRVIAGTRAWIKTYGVVVALTRNPKTPLAVSLNLIPRLNDRDLQQLSVDRNVPEPLRVAARKRVVAATSRH